MKAIAFLIATCLGAAPLPAFARDPHPARLHPKPKIIDLDFANDPDFGAEADPPRSVADPPRASSAPSRQWLYWTLGATLAAAGGVGGYLIYEREKPPTIIRNEQFFNDERP